MMIVMMMILNSNISNNNSNNSNSTNYYYEPPYMYKKLTFPLPLLLLLYLGLIYMDNEEYEKAHEAFENAFQCDQNAETQIMLGLSLFCLHRYADSIKVFDHILKLSDAALKSTSDSASSSPPNDAIGRSVNEVSTENTSQKLSQRTKSIDRRFGDEFGDILTSSAAMNRVKRYRSLALHFLNSNTFHTSSVDEL